MSWIAIVTLGSILIGIGSSYLLGKHNPIEEACEAIIKIETGIDLDLSSVPPEEENSSND